MRAKLGRQKPGIELAALYRRRENILSLIRSIERYQRARVRRIKEIAAGTAGRTVRQDYAK